MSRRLALSDGGAQNAASSAHTAAPCTGQQLPSAQGIAAVATVLMVPPSQQPRRGPPGVVPSLVVAAIALYAAGRAPTVTPSPASGDMSLLTMQRIKSYVDDTCTLDPHCQWTWDPKLPNGLQNVSAEQAAAAMPVDYLFPPPGDDADKPTVQRGECDIIVLVPEIDELVVSRFPPLW